MSQHGAPQLAFPRPGKVLKIVLIGYFALWLIFSLGMNWAGVSDAPLRALMAVQTDIEQGEIWRLFTAAWVPEVRSIFLVLITLFVLYLFGAQLEELWGGKRFATFLFWAGTLAYGAQFLLTLILPTFLADRLLSPFPAGATPIVEACVIAWAFTYPDRIIYLFLVVPVKGRTFIYLTLGINILLLVALQTPQAGFPALFFGMAAGWLLGGSSPSPLRKWYLKYKLTQLEREAEGERAKRKKRAQKSGLQVLPGGKDDNKPPRDLLN